jgi:hypothetical protein
MNVGFVGLRRGIFDSLLTGHSKYNVSEWSRSQAATGGQSLCFGDSLLWSRVLLVLRASTCQASNLLILCGSAERLGGV